jgi:hypothetical protein
VKDEAKIAGTNVGNIYILPANVFWHFWLTANSQPCWQCVIRTSAAVNNECGGLSRDDLALCRASRLGGRRVSRSHSTSINTTTTTPYMPGRDRE